ncbi:uncharacterized protein [Dermacentor albipictus]|uniref:uncharacterized protein isoform X5 n=1 Tax=Dermacentor albipictus TaxID=60249 RepID=UPI0038FC18AF
MKATASRHSTRTWRMVSLSRHLPQVGGSLPVNRKLVLNKNVQDCEILPHLLQVGGYLSVKRVLNKNMQDCEILAALTTSRSVPLSQELVASSSISAEPFS